MHTFNKMLAESIGTFWLVLGGCGSAMLAAKFGNADGINIGLVGVSLAFGLTVLTMAYAVGHISGGHFNPAVSIGLLAGGRFPASELIPYIIAQVVGAVCGAAVLAAIVSGNGSEIGNLASNGFGEASPGKYNMMSVLLTEVIMTAAFLFIIMGATDTSRAASTGGTVAADEARAAGFGPIAIGLALTLIHLISIPVSNTSVNPARSTGPALVSMDSTAIAQLWVFWAAPIVGAVIGALAYRLVASGQSDLDIRA